MDRPLHIVVWNEYRHERQRDDVRRVYPQGIHSVIREGLQQRLAERAIVETATLDEPEHGLSLERLQSTDVLIWWGHGAHEDVSDLVVQRVFERVLEGMGLIVLHSGHASKIFRKLMGTGCMLRWREAGERERLWIVDPSHPIVAGIEGEYFELPETEMYGEFFDIPPPDELILISWFRGGEVFRSGCTFRRGCGRIFYFRPGHETYPIYYDENVRGILARAARWCASPAGRYHGTARKVSEPLEPF